MKLVIILFILNQIYSDAHVVVKRTATVKRNNKSDRKT